MTRTQPAETKSRQRIAAEKAASKMSKAERLQHALQSGVLKSELRTASEAIHAARALHMRIKTEGFADQDIKVSVAYLTPDLSALSTEAFEWGHEAALHTALSSVCPIVVGLTFGIRDMERRNWIVGARPFLNTPLVNAAFKAWLEETYIMNSPLWSPKA